MKVLLDHIVLNVIDVEKEAEFYINVLGFPPERLELYREGKVPFPSVRINPDTIIDLFPAKMWQQGAEGEGGRTNLNHFCVSVSREDFERLLHRLGQLGVAIEQGPVERWGAHGTGVSVYFRDPELNLIEFRYYEVDSEPSQCLLDT
ncbi:MAG: VOC family protein [Geobacteraceae bacterium]|nr:VOC family protein [Geobacteraceae bacterium]